MESKLSFNAMSAKTKSSELDRRRNRKGKTRGEIVGPRTEGKANNAYMRHVAVDSGQSTV